MSKQLGKSLLRSAKNYTKGYSDIQIKVRQATSNDPWGPSGSLMAEISQATFNHRDFLEIMEMIDKRLNDHGKNWRHVFKALTLLDYLLHTGSEAVIAYARENLYVIKTLKEFQYIDDDGKDQGANVRQKSKDITALLADESRLREARQTRMDMRGRMTAGDGFGAPSAGINQGGSYYNEDRELQKALEESRRTAQQDESRRKALDNEEEELQKALELSEKEAIERRMRERDQAMQNQPTGDSAKKDDIIDFFGGLEDTTPTNPYAQQQQSGGYDPFAGFGGTDPFAQQQQQFQQQYLLQQQQQLQLQQQLAQQQQQQQLAQQQFMQQQSNPFGSNPFGGAAPNSAPVQQQLTGDNNALARGSGPIDPFASLAASRSNTNAQNQGASAAGGQFSPFGGNATSSGDPFAAMGGSNLQGIAAHSTGGGYGGQGVGSHSTGGGFGSGVSAHNTGGGFGGIGVASHSTGGFGGVASHSTGGYGGMGQASSQPISQHNTGGGFGMASQNTGSGFGTPNKSASDLVNLDANSLASGRASTGAFGAPAAKNPFQTGGQQGNKYQWETPKPTQPTLAQLAGQNAFGGSPAGNAFGNQQAGGAYGQNAFPGNMGANPLGQQGMAGMQQGGFNQQQPFGAMGTGQGGFQQQQPGFNQFGAQQQAGAMGSGGPFF
ncbi:uncharacterized protein SPPG_00395 [Spizellomyces punctatus DAOM BR117]|uniref:ENTH domain-containing protein n=1 Tax=Spizellomyces punctatus (strain DAOM BR117) TaxID=645134 RepID=A0A0L0HUC4_SPIPD|nr:uncharacterized protein SPPG_00395 [Spizellomyces punctatus DAOM BR117]KND04682.1 hypothetical protein SPPG_00395 [Spizellomyces punctatus DAOM BR117]|eukprot:XP_016612721.1 hypothetical protein SPPG_00395 [Spizellomyces punctatus DAOM BR117]